MYVPEKEAALACWLQSSWGSVLCLEQDLVCGCWLTAAELNWGSLQSGKWGPTPSLQTRAEGRLHSLSSCSLLGVFQVLSVCWPHAILTTALGWRTVPPPWSQGLNSYISTKSVHRGSRQMSAPLPTLSSLKLARSHISFLHVVTYQSRGFQEPWEWVFVKFI